MEVIWPMFSKAATRVFGATARDDWGVVEPQGNEAALPVQRGAWWLRVES